MEAQVQSADESHVTGAPAIRRIVVGVDGSEGARKAIVWTARLARATGAEVVAVNARGTPVVADGFAFMAGANVDDWRLGREKLRAYTQKTLETQWCRALTDAGVRFRAQTVDGGPNALIELADDLDADMVVVGRRGRGGFAELVLGSFSHQLVHHARRPVVVVPNEG